MSLAWPQSRIAVELLSILEVLKGAAHGSMLEFNSRLEGPYSLVLWNQVRKTTVRVVCRRTHVPSGSFLPIIATTT